MITLEVIAGQSAGSVFELDGTVTSIGRAPTNQVVLSDYHLSGEHGQIFREDDRYIYRDLKSTNGSRVKRGEQQINLDDGTHETILNDGDELMLGDPSQPVIVRCRVKIEDDGRITNVFTNSQSGSRLHVSRSVVRAVQREKGALILGDVGSELKGTSEATTNLRSGIIGVPLWDGETIRGVIQVGGERGVFNYGDLDLVTVVANMATLAIENA